MERRKFTREFKLEAVRLIKDRGVSYVQASQDLNVHTSQLREWVKKFSDDPQHAFPGHGRMKPEQHCAAQARSCQAEGMLDVKDVDPKKMTMAGASETLE
jgi:transposase-like protein